jgi:hypothetical protein
MCFRRTFARHDNVSSLMKSQAFPIFHRIPKSAILWLPHAYERSDKGFNNAFACGTRIQPCLAPNMACKSNLELVLECDKSEPPPPSALSHNL